MTRPAAAILDMEGVLHVDWQALRGRPTRCGGCAGAGWSSRC